MAFGCEAFKWTGDVNQTEDPVWACEAIRAGTVWFVAGDILDQVLPKLSTVSNEGRVARTGKVMLIRTLEGIMCADPGDYIIRGIKGEIYPCNPDLFHATYEEVVDGQRPQMDIDNNKGSYIPPTNAFPPPPPR